MIEIVIFNRPLIGYRLNNAVVYASVPDDLSDADAKQYGYEQVKSALEYEQTQTIPSIDGSEMTVIETFIPELPKVKTLKLIGDTYVQFAEDETERTIIFTVEATDQYGDSIEREWEWAGAIDGALTVTPVDEELTVSVSADGVTTSVDIGVYPYIASVPYVDEMALLKDRVEIQELVIDELFFTILPELMGGGGL